ncbi:MAG TPA: thioesterase domain-containing protein [Pseudobacteroides sp.]|uniref:thioesterase II family protein n=1 Tax=Pseudobacteroides sp. TaxID=1968840 RepID=UPI002F95C9C5
MEIIKLFCLPYAGGSATVYSRWKNYIDQNIEVIPIELAGRGKKFSKPLNNSIEDEVNNIFEEITHHIKNYPYAFFGHSMGTLIIHQLIGKIISHNLRMPVHSFMSGRFPPHIKGKEVYHTLPDNEFKKAILCLGGTPKAVADNEELFNLFLPILKSDYKMVEQYEFKQEPRKWCFDISVFYGSNDNLAQYHDVEEWSFYTEKSCDFYKFEGNHFFIHEHEKKIVSTISQILNNKK